MNDWHSLTPGRGSIAFRAVSVPLPSATSRSGSCLFVGDGCDDGSLSCLAANFVTPTGYDCPRSRCMNMVLARSLARERPRLIVRFHAHIPAGWQLILSFRTTLLDTSTRNSSSVASRNLHFWRDSLSSAECSLARHLPSLSPSSLP